MPIMVNKKAFYSSGVPKIFDLALCPIRKNLYKKCFILSHNFRMKILKTSSLWYLAFMIQIKSGLWSFMHIGVVIVNDFHRFGNSWQKNLTVSEIHFSNMIIKEARACLMTLTLFLLAMDGINPYTIITWLKPVGSD